MGKSDPKNYGLNRSLETTNESLRPKISCCAARLSQKVREADYSDRPSRLQLQRKLANGTRCCPEAEVVGKVPNVDLPPTSEQSDSYEGMEDAPLGQ